jgi:Cu(I)/Ag(I) efflux system membrane fusion protein
MNFSFRQIFLLLSMQFLLAPVSALAQPANEERDVLYWYDPMYPQQRFDEPGPSPFMDMDLVPRYAEQDADSEGRAVMRIAPGIMQNLGMRLAAVSREPVRVSIVATGQITFNQRDLAVVQARSGGFVERVYGLAPQDLIEQGAPIADLLVPEWAAVQEEYLALRSLNEPSLIAAARQRMRLAGMPDALIRQLERSGRAQPFWTLRSPIDGVVQSLDVREGMTLSAGSTLAQINGLNTVWLLIEVPEAEIASLEAGQKIQARSKARSKPYCLRLAVTAAPSRYAWYSTMRSNGYGRA